MAMHTMTDQASITMINCNSCGIIVTVETLKGQSYYFEMMPSKIVAEM